MQALSIDLLRRANLDSAALPLHLGRGLSPYEEIEKDAWKNVNTFPGIFLYFFARLIAITNIAITKALTSLYIIDSRFL